MGLRTTDWETTKWKTAKVGGACLFEKPRSGAWKVPRLSDITSGDDDCAYDDDCDSGAWNAMKNQCQLDSNDDSGAGYTNETRYQPNTSRKRRPRAMTVQSHVGSARPIQKQNDWTEIWDLGHTLAFETLRTILLVLLVIVQLGAVWAKHVEEWLNARELQEGSRKHESRAEDGTVAGAMTKTTSEAEPGAEDCKDCTIDRELSLLDCILDISDDISDCTDHTMDPADCTKSTDDSTDLTDPAVESTGCTNCAELIDVQKRHVSSSKGQQLYTNPLVEALMQEHGPGPPNASWQGRRY